MSDKGKGNGTFYCRYYVGHRGRFGHEYMEFEFNPDGPSILAQDSPWTPAVIENNTLSNTWAELRQIIIDNLGNYDLSDWPYEFIGIPRPF